jgi:hypothetical protein
MISTVINTMGPGAIVERFTISFRDLTEADGSQAIALKTLPKGSLILGARVRLREAFAGGTINAATIALGTAGSTADGLMTVKDIFTGVAVDTCYVPTTFGLWQGTYAADVFQATIATGAGNVNTATAGLLDVDLVYIPFSDLAGTGIPAGTGGGYL